MKISSRPSAWRVVAVLLTLTAAAVLTVATPAPRATAATLCSNASCPNGPAYLAVINTSHWGQNSGHNCTNYVAWRLQSAAVPKFTGSGNALKWAGWASAAGYAVNGTPAPGAIAFWDGTTTQGSLGHVAIVESVSGTTITVSQDGASGGFRWSTYDSSYPTAYIHIPAMEAGAAQSRAVLAPGDWDGDGLADLMRITSNNLYLYRGNGAGGFLSGSGTVIGSGWGQFARVLTPGDFTGDGLADLIAVTTSGGLFVYPGNGSGGFQSGYGSQIGSAWHQFRDVLTPGDFNGDGKRNLMAITTTGELYLYPGNGAGGFLPQSLIGSSWHSFTWVLTPGDFSGDGFADLIAIGSDGTMYLYKGNGTGGWINSPSVVGTGWTSAWREVLATKDFSGNGTADVLGVTTTGALSLYNGNGQGGWASGQGTVIGSGW